MAEIVNLRRARKAKEKARQDAEAERNRLAFGRTKAEKSLEDARRELERRRLDGLARDDGET